MVESSIAVVDSKSLLSLFGARDQNLRKIRDTLHVNIAARDGRIHIEGDEGAVVQATGVLENLQALVQRYGVLAPEDVSRALARVTNGQSPAEPPTIEVLNAARKIRPRTP